MKKPSTIVLFSTMLTVLIIFMSFVLTAVDSAFQTKCSKCHALRNPDNYTKDEWKYNVERMAARAGLTPDEIIQITALNTK